MNTGIYEKSLEHVLRTISSISGRSEIDNLAGLKTMAEKNEEIPAEEMQIYTSPKNNCRHLSYQKQSPGKHWGMVHLSQDPFLQKLEKHSAGEEIAEKVIKYNFATKMDVRKTYV